MGLSSNLVDEPRLIRRTLEIGLTGALSSAYSQSPMLFAAWLLPLDVAAVFAVIYRVVQALELLPATASTQLVPRVERSRRLVRMWLIFVGGGTLISLVLMLTWPVFSLIFAIDLPIEYTTPISAAFALKCGNYALVSYLLGSGRIRQRLVITVTTGISALIVVPTLILGAGGIGLALAAVAIEFVFLAATVLVLRGSADSPLRKESV